MRLRVICSSLMVTFSQPAYSQDDVHLNAHKFTDLESCLTVLAEFAWACDFYNSPKWTTFYREINDGESYWDRTKLIPTPAYRYDLDGDGLDDMIVRINFAFCSQGGWSTCKHLFLFADQNPENMPHVFGINSDDPPIISFDNEGVASVRFGKDSTTVYPISSIKENTLSSPRFNF